MSNGVGTGDGPDAVWRQGSLKPGHEWEQGCLPLKLIFYRIQGERLHRKWGFFVVQGDALPLVFLFQGVQGDCRKGVPGILE